VRPSWKGFYITAIDGDQYNLQRSSDALEHDYRGYPLENNKESYGLKMYVLNAVDVVTGAPLMQLSSHKIEELSLGISATEKVFHLQNDSHSNRKQVKKQIFIYDRLYLCSDFLSIHQQLESNFIARCKKKSTFSEIVSFEESQDQFLQTTINGNEVFLLKHTYKDEEIILCTNIKPEIVTPEEVAWLYSRRWEVETTNCHATKTLAIEKFHSTKINGIKQEIYSCLWTLLCAISTQNNIKCRSEDFQKSSYRKQNTKAVRNYIMNILPSLLIKISKLKLNKLEVFSKKTNRTSERFSRSFPRMRKYNTQKTYLTPGSVERSQV
jgi:hypothetical protein